MSQPKKRQEIHSTNYDEFLGHPDFPEEQPHEAHHMEYAETSGTESIHEVARHAKIKESMTREMREEAKSRPAPPRPAPKKPTPPSRKRGEETASYDEFLGHPDFVGDMVKAVHARELPEIEGQ